MAAIRAWYSRYWGPGGGAGNPGGDLGSNRFAQAQAVTAVGRRGGGKMARVPEQLIDSSMVMGKTAAGQYHALARPDLHPLAIQFQLGTH